MMPSSSDHTGSKAKPVNLFSSTHALNSSVGSQVCSQTKISIGACGILNRVDRGISAGIKKGRLVNKRLLSVGWRCHSLRSSSMQSTHSKILQMVNSFFCMAKAIADQRLPKTNSRFPLPCLRPQMPPHLLQLTKNQVPASMGMMISFLAETILPSARRRNRNDLLSTRKIPSDIQCHALTANFGIFYVAH